MVREPPIGWEERSIIDLPSCLADVAPLPVFGQFLPSALLFIVALQHVCIQYVYTCECMSQCQDVGTCAIMS